MRTRIVDQWEEASDTYRIRIEAPAIANATQPGQFVMIRLADCNDPLIGRALAIYDRYREGTASIAGQAPSHSDWSGIDLVYVAKGKLTTRLARQSAGAEVELWGPLGNRFSTRPVDHLVMVAGGVGETPMLCLGKEALGRESFGADRPHGYARKVTLCYGARSARYLACVDAFRKNGFDVRISTDDGTMGKKQLVTHTLEQVLDESSGSIRIACCGPEPMMEAVSRLAMARSVACEVSLETPMACGIGICFTCVAKIRQEECHGQAEATWDYHRTCVEGPIFDAEKVVW